VPGVAAANEVFASVAFGLQIILWVTP